MLTLLKTLSIVLFYGGFYSLFKSFISEPLNKREIPRHKYWAKRTTAYTVAAISLTCVTIVSGSELSTKHFVPLMFVAITLLLTRYVFNGIRFPRIHSALNFFFLPPAFLYLLILSVILGIQVVVALTTSV